MAPYSSSKYRLSAGRASRKGPKVALKGPNSEASEGPPLKKRRYIPGGPGAKPELESQQVLLPPPPPPPPAPTTSPSARLRREKSQSRGRYGSSTAAALALQQGDGYKPREERGWEEFHPDLDIDAKIAVFSAEEVDRPAPSTPIAEILQLNGIDINSSKDPLAELIKLHTSGASPSPIKRKPGRPPRRPEAILNALGITPQPKAIPPPGPNPRERLTLPKPSFRLRDPFVFYDQPGVGQRNYVDRTMASVGYQESDLFVRHERQMIRMTEGAQEDDLDIINPPTSEGEVNASVGRVEYDMDEQDEKWLEDYNAKRREEQLEPIKPAVFEITMTKIEKEWHTLEKRIPKPNPKPPQTQRPRSSSAAAVNGETTAPGEEQDSKCAICDDGDCENSNAIVFCDGCDLAVHQECYGVPFIPEGQWLCRKCQLIGRGSVNCIFCPNTEGAFKQTTSSKWSHLLCAIWIPEVSLGNPSLMEPVTDVEKVPRSRWKLTCYICKQRMGASIQCSNKNCFVAFHPTCARRAQLYLKMKSGHGAPAIMDSHLLKAFCDKHVPDDWRLEHGTDAATADAIEYYRNTMQGRQWGDSQAAALSLEPSYPLGVDPGELDGQRTHTPRITLTVGGNKRKRIGTPKTIWKLPSGAPVIPQVVLNSVVASLQRFGVRQRKQYAEDACKYWTLKREARRGAALLKRLQLSLETFSSMEMTRRDYVAMGVSGGKRLQRRIEFGERLSYDLDRLRMLCDEVKKREREKLKDAELLRSIVDTVYFPIFPLLWPIYEKAQGLDGKGVFKQGLLSLRTKLQQRYYTSVAAFSADLASIFTSEIGVQPAGDTAELQMQISGRAPELPLEQREKRKLAKRIIKAIQPALEDAIKKESELNRKPFEKELKELDLMFENSVLSRRGSVEEGSAEPAEGEARIDNPVSGEVSDGVQEKVGSKAGLPAKVEPQEESSTSALPEKAEDTATLDAGNDRPIPDAQAQDTPMTDSAELTASAAVTEPEDQIAPGASATIPTSAEAQQEAGPSKEEANSSPLLAQLTESQKGLLTPPPSFQGDPQHPLSQGGILWYMQPFDPVGTTIHEERWTGRDVMRGMSEELSELDEDELKDLVDDEMEGNSAPTDTAAAAASDAPTSETAVKVHRTRRRWRGFK
ncbi:hypothetical protein KXW39_004139 [Aspergillus fumigatus]|nr:hypothetical protein KXX17_009630 [Aspergillus fumigatus]KAH1641135.1 hypothetical protein KXX39_001254 [Aspergillus fumigatus]KAH1711233.1 hypothetical protein KXX23_007591 [Aspergillus fumigatus]KAH1716453.1 hypothetical protein KXX40_003255 [Aspergillus fumigatus]KAH1763347.1 hypothetical protein KXX56_008123 [Aspergillus fumigatus]